VKRQQKKRAGSVFIPACPYAVVSIPKYPQHCLVTLPRFGEKNQSAADIRARHQYISGLQSDTKGSLPFYFVLKKNSSLPSSQQPTRRFLFEEAG